MKRYMVFAYPDYYPSGGLSDMVSSHDDITEAKLAADEEYDNDNVYIWDQVENSYIDYKPKKGGDS